MRRAIELAKKGIGWVNPNPLVGAVIVKNKVVIGEGFHEAYGHPHAERNALASCVASPEGATLYVTLEPCCHFGKTPPCTQAILESGMKRVVIGSPDPNPKVSKKGTALLRKSGLSVTEDFLIEECKSLNQIFFHYITTGFPYLALKYAMTADGKIATVTGESKWITNESSRQHVHFLRSQYSAIMVGINTVLQDDPLLTCRAPHCRNPIRIICDCKLKIPLTSQICRTAKEVPTIIATAAPNGEKSAQLELLGIQVLICPASKGQIDLAVLWKKLAQQNIDSILIEGGAALNYSALESGYVQKIYSYTAPKILGGTAGKTPVGGKGIADLKHCISLSSPQITVLEGDVLLEYEVRKELDDFVYRNN